MEIIASGCCAMCDAENGFHGERCGPIATAIAKGCSYSEIGSLHAFEFTGNVASRRWFRVIAKAFSKMSAEAIDD